MSLETSALKLCAAIGCGADRAMSAKVRSCVKTRSWIGAIVMVLPLFGLDAIIYAVVLWGMYSSLSRMSGVPFKSNLVTNIIGGFIVNIVVVFCLNFILDFIPGLGWIGSGLVGFFGMYLSGVSYIEILTRFHGKNKVKERLDYNAFGQGFKDAGGKGALRGMATGMTMGELAGGADEFVDNSDMTPGAN